MIVKLTYFKRSGKYYSEGEYESSCTEMYEVHDEVRAMNKHPGLLGKWSEYIHITTDSDNEVPHLIIGDKNE